MMRWPTQGQLSNSGQKESEKRSTGKENEERFPVRTAEDEKKAAGTGLSFLAELQSRREEKENEDDAGT